MKQSIGAAALAALALSAGSAEAIVAPASVTVNIGGSANPQFFAIDNIIDQSGLATKYTSGVTDFDAFIALNQGHESALGTRWHSQSNLSAARVTFDFGREVNLSRLALWDDRSTTVSRIKLSTPDLGLFRDLVVSDVIQTTSYAQVFNFASVTTRYLTFDIEGCNKGVGSGQNWSGCGLQEVVFGESVGVPEPATWAMMILGFGAAGAALRRRQGASVAA
jgi:hypothetical protein